MSELVFFEYAPPRSWEQFEELCADLFQVMWSDPTLARHGRAGQAQYGVDIVASRGGVFPVGLQCKKKGRWPPRKLTIAEIDREVAEAEKFRPVLKEFYILTTAMSDERLQKHIRLINETRGALFKFQVTILFWSEIVRHVALFERVARKHFPIGSSSREFAPLLATWYVKDGEIELSEAEFLLSVLEIGEDLVEWPTGRVLVRQREADTLISKLRSCDHLNRSLTTRQSRVALRRDIRRMREKEERVERKIRLLYARERLRFYMTELDPSGVDSAEILRSIIEREVVSVAIPEVGKIRLSPPTPEKLVGPFTSYSAAYDDIPVHLSYEETRSLSDTERRFGERYGSRMVRVVSELPKAIRNRLAIPAILDRIDRIMSEDQKTAEEMELAGYFDLNLWKYSV